MRRIGMSLIEQRQAEATKEQAAAAVSTNEKPTPVAHAAAGRDILSVLVRSNLASVPSQRLSLDETLCQISTFLSAGHETSAAALTWTLYALARAPDIQARLRRELRSVPLPSSHPPSSPQSSLSTSPTSSAIPDADSDTVAAVLTHPYLDAVVREALRLHAPVTSTMRVAGKDDVVPVARPFVDRRGRACDAIRVRQGDIITVPLQAMNKSKEVWGEDAEVFRPERWLEGGEAEEDEGEDGSRWEATGRPGRGQRRAGPPGLWGNMLTFLNGNPLNGNRACIGFRFAINE